MACSLISLTSLKETPEWDHGLRVTPGGQPKQHSAKEEKREAANISGRGKIERAVLFKSQLIAKLDQWKV